MASQIFPSLSFEQYQKDYRRSLEDPEGFWGEKAQRLRWMKKWDRVKNTSFLDEVSIRWFEGGVLNVCDNCVDRHLPEKEDEVAILWEPDEPHQPGIRWTYGELHRKVIQFALVLKKMGVRKGDRVTLYLPMIPETAVAMLACARIGAIHSVVFGGFSAESIADRIQDCESTYVITADGGIRGGKAIPLKATMNQALEKCPDVRACLTLRSTGQDVPWKEGRDVWFHDLAGSLGGAKDCPPEPMSAEDPLFILYTSGSTGKPKGVLHTTGGYLVYASLTHELVFDYRPGEVYWCTADVGWVTGHSYMIYGPLANGATTLLFEGVPHYPDCSRFWQGWDKHQVNLFYTAPPPFEP